MSAWLEDGDGRRVRVPARGVLFGRGPDCDVHLADPRASRAHAWVRPGADGIELLVLGRNGSQVNGAPAHGTVRLADGDALGFPGLHLRLVHPGGAARGQPWVLAVGDWRLVVSGTLSIGDTSDDLCLRGLARRSAVLRTVREALFVEATAALEVDGQVAARGEVLPLEPGAQIAIGGHVLQLDRLGEVARGTRDDTTSLVTAPLAARFTFLPVGGRLTLVFHERTLDLELSEMRSRLVAALLRPPSGYAVGDFVPDDVLLPAIWPHDEGKDRLHLNSLVHRTRKALLTADVDPRLVLERLAAGGATRFRLAPGGVAEVT